MKSRSFPRAAWLLISLLFFCAPRLQAQLAGQWKAIGPLSSPVEKLTTDGTALYANSYAGIYRSMDQGETWSLALPNAPMELYRDETFFNRVLQLDASPSGVYALGHDYENATLVRSVNQGPWAPVAGWDSVRDYLLDSWDRPVTFIAAGSRLLAGKLGHPDLVRSDDGGATWTLQPHVLPGGVHLFWEWDAQNHVLHFGKTGQVSASYDQGLSWHPYPTGSLPAAPAAIAAKGPRLYAAVPGYGLYRSASWVPWVRVQSQPPFTDITGLAISNDRLYAASARQGVWQSTDHGVTWLAAGLEDELLSGLYTLDGTLFACGADGVYRKAPGANTWTPFVEGLGNARVTRITTGASGLFVAGFEEGSYDDEEESGTIYASAHPNRRWAQIEGGRSGYGYMVKQLYPQQDTLTAVFRTSASNDLYEGILVLQFSLLNNRPVLMMLDSAGAYQGEEMDHVVSAAYAGEVYFVSGGSKNLYRSPATPVFPGPVNRIYARGQVLIAATPNGIFYSFDQAQTWPVRQLHGQNVLSITLRGACYYAETPQGYWQSTSSGGWNFPAAFTPGVWSKGILYRVNSGVVEYRDEAAAAWTPLPGTPAVTAIAANDDFLYAGTNGQGVWRTSTLRMAQEASEFSLRPAADAAQLTAFPNPAGEFLAVEALESGQLELISIEGRVLLAQSFSPPQQVLSLASVPAGVYTLRLRSGTAVQTLRIVRQ
ncbi:MAG: T9SS type A sorting domain-containing protein [Bacteroidia bacterium]|nr:T9SS type A sorting domain-containing protein [Bacteroidia bacterium]